MSGEPVHRGARLAPLAMAALAALAVLLSTARPASAASRTMAHPAAADSRRAAASARQRLLVLVDLAHLRKRGAIEPAAQIGWRAEYLAALNSLRALSGTRHAELAAVLANLRSIAAAKGLTPSRAPSLFLTLRRNREWWTKGSLLSYGQRVTFPGSRLIWEYYPGQGIELQWLATFGEANGYFLSGDENEALKQVLEEALSLASARAGGISWDYLFHFDDGSPPWTSGLSQGTALQAFARAGQRLREPRFTAAAGQALGIFQTPPPEGVLSTTGGPGAVEGGVEYLEYSYAPEEHIVNGFVQALNGLYDYTKLTQSPLGEKLFEQGDLDARSEVPHYDTGAWSLYDQSSESDLSYHELLAEFLQNLCGRTQGGPPLAGEQTGSEGATGQEGGIPGDEVYCSTASDFRSYLHAPPTIVLLSRTAKRGFRAGVMFSLSKVSTISMTVSEHRSGKVLWRNTATVEAGRPRLLWVTPRHGGVFDVSATAVDLAGNRATTSGTITIPSAPKRKPKAHGRAAQRRRR